MGRGRVVIRCDASPTIGGGHLVRCGSLSVALRERGIEPVIATRFPEAAAAALQRFDLEVVRVQDGAGHDDALALADAEATASHAVGTGAALVVVDHYGADASYFEAIRASVPLAVIDDRADRDLTAADLVLNQNFRAPGLDYRVAPHTKLLLGPDYALLRPEFVKARAALSRTFTPDDRRVLITFGGGETSDECIAALHGLDGLDREVEVRCILGPGAARDGRVEAQATMSRQRVEVIRGVDDMTQHMTWADVSLNAGGSTCWELLCLGLPMVTVALGADQDGNVRTLPDAGLAVAATSPASAAPTVASLLASSSTRRRMSFAGMDVVDGLGASRAARALDDLIVTKGAADVRH